MELDDDDGDSIDQTRSTVDNSHRVSDHLVTTSDPDVDLIDLQSDLTLSEIAINLDQFGWEQTEDLEASVRRRAPTTSSPAPGQQTSNISADWAETSSILHNIAVQLLKTSSNVI